MDGRVKPGHDEHLGYLLLSLQSMHEISAIKALGQLLRRIEVPRQHAIIAISE